MPMEAGSELSVLPTRQPRDATSSAVRGTKSGRSAGERANAATGTEDFRSSWGELLNSFMTSAFWPRTSCEPRSWRTGFVVRAGLCSGAPLVHDGDPVLRGDRGAAAGSRRFRKRWAAGPGCSVSDGNFLLGASSGDVLATGLWCRGDLQAAGKYRTRTNRRLRVACRAGGPAARRYVSPHRGHRHLSPGTRCRAGRRRSRRPRWTGWPRRSRHRGPSRARARGTWQSFRRARSGRGAQDVIWRRGGWRGSFGRSRLGCVQEIRDGEDWLKSGQSLDLDRSSPEAARRPGARLCDVVERCSGRGPSHHAGGAE